MPTYEPDFFYKFFWFIKFDAYTLVRSPTYLLTLPILIFMEIVIYIFAALTFYHAYKIVFLCDVTGGDERKLRPVIPRQRIDNHRVADIPLREREVVGSPTLALCHRQDSRAQRTRPHEHETLIIVRPVDVVSLVQE